MIVTCRHCHRSFWRYRRDWPPPFSCSISCWHAQAGKVIEAEPPLPPQDVLAAMKAHRWLRHGAISILAHIDCPYCEALEQQYAESLRYHLDERMRREAGKEGQRLKWHAEARG